MELRFDSYEQPSMYVPDAYIVSVNSVNEFAMTGDTLSWDELDAVISIAFSDTYLETSDEELFETADDELVCVYDQPYNIDHIAYGQAIYLYDTEPLGCFYCTKLQRTSKYNYKLTAVSRVGLWDKVTHNGGIYTGQSFEDMLEEMLPECTYTIDDDAAAVNVYGWLPAGTVRANLHQLLFATGINLFRQGDGSLRFGFSVSDDSQDISDSSIFKGGSVSYLDAATDIAVTEHGFYQTINDKTVTLFDNTDGSGEAADYTVTFKNPCYDLEASDSLEITESGANYAIVNGTGTLTGTEYTHSTRTVTSEAQNNDWLAQKTAKVENAYLVNYLNSEEVSKRVLACKSTGTEVKIDIIRGSAECGDYIQFKNPFGDIQSGFITQMNMKYTTIYRAACKVLSGYAPSGGGNSYSAVELITETDSWTVPEGVTRIKIVLIGGGSGGTGGHGGMGGGYSSVGSGKGGAGSPAGNGGYIYSRNLDVEEGDVITVTQIGAGGAGGAGSSGTTYSTETEAGTAGEAGGHSVCTYGDETYSSENGALMSTGYVELISGTVYGGNGADGIKGGTGSPGGDDEYVTYKGVQYTVGEHGNMYRNSSMTEIIGIAGYGGGPAAGVNGGAGNSGYRNSSGNLVNGYGGAGATPVDADNGVTYGAGGSGGHGGGGGGQGAGTDAVGDAVNGRGGNGGKGGDGADGCVLIYY